MSFDQADLCLLGQRDSSRCYGELQPGAGGAEVESLLQPNLDKSASMMSPSEGVSSCLSIWASSSLVSSVNC